MIVALIVGFCLMFFHFGPSISARFGSPDLDTQLQEIEDRCTAEREKIMDNYATTLQEIEDNYATTVEKIINRA